MNSDIRIGTRDSELALWQATQVKNLLEQKGYTTRLIPVKSEGDHDLITPLYAMGVQGVFTRALDSALLNNQIDLAVHSMKDVPTQLPVGIIKAAVLPRGAVRDLLVYKSNTNFLNDQQPAIIATGSVRRKAQWLHRYPHHIITDLRGNVNTRLQKLYQANWQGAIFAQAGLERIHLLPADSMELNWMLPAPAQGAVMISCRTSDEWIKEISNTLNDPETAFCVSTERDFLQTLLGGCSTPIGAYARIENGQLLFDGNIVSTDGKYQKSISKIAAQKQATDIGRLAAKELLEQGGKEILQQIKTTSKNIKST